MQGSAAFSITEPTGERSENASAKVAVTASGDTGGGLAFVPDDDREDNSISRLSESVAAESGSQKGQRHQEGSSIGRSGEVGEPSCHPLAKKCDGECDEPDLNTAQYWRKRRYARREALWRVTNVQRCAYCGRVPYSADQGVQCYRKEWTDGEGNQQSAGRIEGVQTCGNVNLCPVCARDVRRERAAKINRAVQSHLDAGGGVLEFLFTLRHSTEHSLRQQLDAMKAGWAAMMQASVSWGARKVKERMGHVGHYWKNEAPWNPENGWNVHRHGVFFTEEPIADASELEEINSALFGLYKDAVQKEGMPCPSKELNNVVPIGRGRTEGEESIGGYMMKTDSGAKGRMGGAGRVGQEVARGDEKEGRKGLMPFQLLDLIGDACSALDHFRAEKEKVIQSGGDPTWKRRRIGRVRRELELWEGLWSEYEQAVEGEKMMQGSRGFDDELVPESEEETEPTPREEAEEEQIGEVPSHLFRHLSRFSGGVSLLLETIEGKGYIRREGNRIVAVGEGEPVDLEGLIEALRLDWWRTEVDESELEGPLVGVQYRSRVEVA